MARKKVIGVQRGTGKLVHENTPHQQKQIAKAMKKAANKNNRSNKSK